MKHFKYILILCCFSATSFFAQPTFTSIDSLLTKNFDAVNLQDSAYYMSLLNHQGIFKDRKIKTKADSLDVLKPFSDAFSDMIDELIDFAGNDDIEVKYESYDPLNSREFNAKVTGKIIVHVKLVINNTFTVKVPFTIMAYSGLYTIENPMMVMFAD